MGPPSTRTHGFGEPASALRYLTRGGSNFELDPAVESSNRCTVTEGDLSGGGGQTMPPGRCTSDAGAARVLIAERLHQVEHTLAAQHDEVLLLVNQLMVGPSYKLELAPLRLKAEDISPRLEERARRPQFSPGLEKPATPERPTSDTALRSFFSPGPEQPPSQEKRSSLGRAGRPISSSGHTGRPTMPHFATNAQKMVLPGQLVEADDGSDSKGLSLAKKEEKESDASGVVKPPSRERRSSVGPPRHPLPVLATTTKRMSLPGELVEADNRRGSTGTCKPLQEHFEVSDVFKRKRAQHGSRFDSAAEVIKRTSQIDDSFLLHTNFQEGWVKRVILHPNSPLRALWDILSMALVLYDMIMVPFSFFDPQETPLTLAFEWITRIFWSLDIPVSLVSGYVTLDGTIELRFARILSRYLRSWFLLDIAVVGADWTEVLMGQALDGMDVARMSKFTRVFRIIRMIRLLRLAKVGGIISLLAERLPSEKLVVFVDIIKLVVTMLGIGHGLACGWYAIGKDLGPPERLHWNWLAKYEFAEEPIDYRYIMSLRWALSQFAGGMDEVTPVSLGEHIYAGFVCICAFWSGTVFLSILTSHFTQLYILGNQQSQQLNVMRRYLAQHGISKGLVLRVTRNAQHTMKMRQRATPEAAVGLLEAVSEPLRMELHYEMYFPLLGSHEFFSDYMKQCPFVVRRICHAAMTTSAYSKEDVIFHFGEAASRMLIVRSGSMLYSWGADSSEQLGEGKCISEAPLWTHWSHRGVLTAREDTIVFCVVAELFQAIVSRFEIAIFDPGEYASRFVLSLNSTSHEDLTDLPLQRTAARKQRGMAGLVFTGSKQPPGLDRDGLKQFAGGVDRDGH